MEASQDFDLLAASLRADSRDLRAFVEALAAKLEGSFGDRVRVERSGFLGGKRVKRVSVELGDNQYELDHDDGHVSCRRSVVVRGISLKSEPLHLEGWIDELSRGLLEEAQRSENGRLALERLLGR